MHYFLDQVDRQDEWVDRLFHHSERYDQPQRQSVGLLSRSAGEAAPQITPGSSLALQPIHADPLSPLRQRDLEALAELFDHSYLPEIDQDLRRRLQQLVPEPPWEVEPYEFLRAYI